MNMCKNSVYYSKRKIFGLYNVSSDSASIVNNNNTDSCLLMLNNPIFSRMVRKQGDCDYFEKNIELLI